VHKLLQRQLRRCFGVSADIAPEYAAFIAVVGDAYVAADTDRLMIERSLELMSQELNQRNAELRSQLEEKGTLVAKLEEAHHQLLQSEKLASIGQLAAGVAHEINNPIGFVNSNLSTLGSYVDDFLMLIAAYERAEPLLPHDSQTLTTIADIKRKIEVDHLREDVLNLLSESADGIKRVTQIVQDLKDFSHIGETDWHWADVHKGIDSTLNIVSNEIKYKADVVKHYGSLPRIECLPSQLNQVFMNLLVNAAHAIGDERGVITVRTIVENEEVRLEFSDNGSGITPENLKRIFDPFFTTKAVGKGTGLGLSLAYSIIGKHHGKIEVDSELGRGTTFRLLLPVTQPRSVIAD